jgi:hypothetical protein
MVNLQGAPEVRGCRARARRTRAGTNPSCDRCELASSFMRRATDALLRLRRGPAEISALASRVRGPESLK